MDILERIAYHAKHDPDRAAYRNGSQSLTWGELWTFSDRLSHFLAEKTGTERPAVVVYGHKHPLMPVSFIACMKAGLAYCPVDTSMPAERIRDILAATETPLVLSPEPSGLPGGVLPESPAGSPLVLGLSRMEEILRDASRSAVPERRPDDGDICYIIFTSGSTGKPKGVQIPYGCLCRFTEWGLTLGTSAEQKEGRRFLNQAPFSFDLSVMDLYLSLASGGTLCTLDKTAQQDYKLLFERLLDYRPQVWVSTPSFAEVCLADPDFNGEHLPELALFLFCGERLTNRTAGKLSERFPGAKVMNTYGPTESTVAVTEVLVTPELIVTEDPLPVGRPKPGTQILILTEDGQPAPEGEAGEIFITGDTLAAGYYRAKELTDGAFRPVPADVYSACTGKASPAGPVRGYHTGDEGYLRDGMLYYNGRIDLQVKLHGYRIELSDIENNLLRLPQVAQACVVPSERDGRVSQLHAFVVMQEREEANDRRQAALLKEALSGLLPEYMIPRKFHFISRIPMTTNGKADRRKLKEMLG